MPFYFSVDQLGNGRGNSTIEFFLSPVADFDNPGTPVFSTTTDFLGRALYLSTDLADGIYDVRTTLANSIVDWEREFSVRFSGSGMSQWSDYAGNLYRLTGKVGIGFDPNITPYTSRFEVWNDRVGLPIISYKAAPDDGMSGPQSGNWWQLLDEFDYPQAGYSKDDTGFGLHNGFTLFSQGDAPAAPKSLKDSTPSEPLTWIASVKHKASFGAFPEYWRMGLKNLVPGAPMWYLQREDSYHGTLDDLITYDGTNFNVLGAVNATGGGSFYNSLQALGGVFFISDTNLTPNSYLEWIPTSFENPGYSDGFQLIQNAFWRQTYWVQDVQQDPVNPIDPIVLGVGWPFLNPESSVFGLQSGFGQLLEYVREDGLHVFKDTGGLAWSSFTPGSGVRSGTKHTGITKDIPGRLQVYDGITPGTYRDLKVRQLFTTTPLITSDEIPSGALDGVNTVFTTATPYVALSLHVYLNGLRLTKVTDYTETTASSFTFVTAPLPSDTLRIDYQPA